MKSLTAVCQTAGGATSMPAMNPNGRIARHPPHRGDGENAEMKMYLSKLKDLVPFMPKNRKLSKLEIIQHVIDYICDLQTELETHPEINNFDAAAALSGVAAAVEDDDSEMDEIDEMQMDNNDMLALRLAAEQQQQQQQQLTKISSPATAATRLPLIDRQTPNTILPAAALALAASAAATTATSAAQNTTAAAAAPVQQSPESLTTQHSDEKDSRQS